MINILIPEETPSLNKGEAAILSGMLETFNMLGDSTCVSMFSLNPGTDASRYAKVKIIDARGIMPSAIMFKSKSTLYKASEYVLFIIKHFLFLLIKMICGHKVLKLMKRDVWKEYCQADIIIMAHDSAYTPLYHFLLICFFKSLNKLVIIYGATLSPPSERASQIKKITYSYVTKAAVRRVDLITLREKMSYKYIKNLVDNDFPVYLTGDLAFLERSAPDERVHEIMEQESILDSKPMIGVTVSQNKVNFAFPNIKDYPQKEEKFIAIFGQAIDYMIETYKVTVVFIPHSILENTKRDDRILAQKIFQVLKNKHKVKTIINEYTAEELRGLTGKFDFCLGTRLHFIVDSCSMLVPSIMIANHDDYRTHGIFGDMLGQNKWIFNIEDINHVALIEMLKEGWKSREDTRKKLIQKIELAKKQTLENAKLLNDLIKRKNVKR